MGILVLTQRVVFYKRSDGKCPYKEWFNNLKDEKTRAKIDVRLDRLTRGNFGDCKGVGEGLLELKMDFGPGYRVYFGRDGLDVVIVLSGGTKSGQDKDIKKAKELWNEYKKRKKEDGLNN